MCDMKSFQKCLLRLGLLFIVLIIITNGIFSFFIFNKYDYNNNSLLSEIDNTINGKLIESIEFRKSCHGEEEKLSFGIWDGTIEGCDCGGIVYKNKCSESQTSNGCIPLYSNPPIKYTIINSHFICAKMSKFKYKEIVKKNKVISKEEVCPENYKSCGILDSFGKILCILIDETCPINSVTIRKKFNDFFNLTKSFDINPYYTFSNLSNETNAHLISQIKLTQYRHCANPFEKFWDYYYILEPPDQRCITEINGKLYDERYQRIFNSSINKLILYNENSITVKLKDIDEVSLNRIKEDKLYFFSRYFIGFEYKELEKSVFNYENLISNQNSANNCILITKYYIYVILGSLVIMIVLIVFIEKLPEIPKSGGECKKDALICLSSFIFFLSFALSPFIYLVIFAIILTASKEIRLILDIKGGDEYTTKLVEIYLKNNISTNIIYSWAIICFCLFILLIFILFVIIWCVRKKKKNKKTINKSDLLLGAFVLGVASGLSRAESEELNEQIDNTEKIEDE